VHHPVAASGAQLLHLVDVLWWLSAAASPRARGGHGSGCLGGYLATGSADRTIRVTDLAGGFTTHQFTGHGWAGRRQEGLRVYGRQQ